MSRKEAIALVDEAFERGWNPHTTAQVDNNIRDVLYEVVAKLIEHMASKGKRLTGPAALAQQQRTAD